MPALIVAFCCVDGLAQRRGLRGAPGQAQSSPFTYRVGELVRRHTLKDMVASCRR